MWAELVFNCGWVTERNHSSPQVLFTISEENQCGIDLSKFTWKTAKQKQCRWWDDNIPVHEDVCMHSLISDKNGTVLTWRGFWDAGHQLDHTQTICTSLQTDNHTNTSSLNFCRPDALLDAQPTVVKALKAHNKTTYEHHFCTTSATKLY